MPIPPEVLPFLVRSISDDVRPLCEKAAILVVSGAIMADSVGTLMARLDGIDDSEIVDDGRASEGIAPPTVGELRALAQFLSETLTYMTRHAAYPTVQKLCVRKPQVG